MDTFESVIILFQVYKIDLDTNYIKKLSKLS